MSDLSKAPKRVRDAWLNDKAKHARLSAKGGRASRKPKFSSQSKVTGPKRTAEYYERARQIAAARGLHD
jgi:hypothetical protein